MCGLTSIATMVAIALTRLAVTINSFGSLKLTRHFTLSLYFQIFVIVEKKNKIYVLFDRMCWM
jgi:hypothetical protein